MPKIVFTQKDKDSIKKVDEGFWGVECMGCEEKPNSKKDGTNFIFEFKVVSDGSNKDRYINHLVSSKGIAYGFGVLAAAISGKSIDEVEVGEYDTDNFIGKKLIIEVEHEMYEGKPQSRIKNFFNAQNEGIELSS